MNRERLRHWLVMAVLGLSGGTIFLLPFLQEIYYNPLLDALQINNTQLGSLLSIFGVSSMLSYLPGGWLADRVSPRKLMTLSLLLTGGLGFYFATFPSLTASRVIHACWGVSITLLFWSSMIRATRNWAPPDQQGKAFGLLESGRGVAEVAVASALLAGFGLWGASGQALSTVIMLLSAVTCALGLLSWWVIEDDPGARSLTGAAWADVKRVLAMPVVWCIAIVVLAGYSAYWGTFRFTPYATDMFALSVTLAGVISVGKGYLKPVGALLAGLVADRVGIARTVCLLFLVLVISFAAFAFLPGVPSALPVMLLGVAIVSLATYALRGIYFALLEEGGVPMAMTGIATGLVSVVGFTPDIFMPLLGGMLLDAHPGALGYRYFFLATAGICVLGLLAALAILRRLKCSKGVSGAHGPPPETEA